MPLLKTIPIPLPKTPLPFRGKLSSPSSEALRNIPNYPVWLASDLDGTYLVQDDLAQQRLNRVVKNLRKQGQLGLIFITGNPAPAFEKYKPRLPEADVVVLENGRFIFQGDPPSSNDFRAYQHLKQPVPAWETQFAQFDAAQVHPILLAYAKTHQDFAEILSMLTPTTIGHVGQTSYLLPIEKLQEHNPNQPHRVQVKAVANAIKHVLKQSGMHADALVDMDWNRDQYVIFVRSPQGKKENALAFLMKHLNIAPEQLIVAGDSLNDQGMLQQADGRHVIMACKKKILGTYRQELKVFFQKHFSKHWAGKFYLATQDASILEGVRTFLGKIQREDQEEKLSPIPKQSFVKVA